ncbi:MAG TPA: autotransporter outer membrane beta-barrel domain-containing protein, partial [Methylovirgula sp.]|nr:autotransporter outer membrane beta-barrel domain-containing protein [Methylovirgula sp.]
MARRDCAFAECADDTHVDICKSFIVAATAAMLVALSAGSASAQAVWRGTTSNDWTDGTNWSSGTAPTAGSTVAINSATNNPILLGVGGAAAGTVGALVFGGTAGSTISLIIQNGSTLTSTGALFRISANTGSTDIVTVTGAGSQLSGSAELFMALGGVGTGILNIENGGLVTDTAGINLANTGGTAAINISSGGTLQTSFLVAGTGNAQINFDNGTLRATASNANFFQNFAVPQLNIAAGGATIDTAGFSIGGPGFSGVGGLTKIGAGTLT